ncbi:MAG: MFS transporter, partial [Anaerolineaceae bacterium]|nr:MFS transporter [Anaerolineaceae bacterium]
SMISVIFTGGSLGYALGSNFGGWLNDRLPGHKVMGTALLFFSAFLILIPIIHQLWLLVFLFALIGFCNGIIEISVNTFILWIHKSKSGPFMNALHFFFGAGAFISPLLISLIMTTTGRMDWGYWGLALLIIPVAVYTWTIRSPQISEPQEKAADEPSANSNQKSSVFIALITIFFFLYAGAEIAFSAWVFTYAKLKLPPDLVNQAYQLSSAFWGTMTIGRGLAIPLAFWINNKKLLLADLIGAIISLGMIVVGSQSITALWIGTILLGLSMSSIFPLSMTYAESILPITGRVSRWFYFGVSAGFICFPLLLGQLFEFISPDSIMVTLLITMAIALMIFIALLRQSNQYGQLPTGRKP